MIHKDSRDGINLILRAQLFAMEAHAGQVRKYTGEAYFEHCAAVAQRVAEKTDDEEFVAYLQRVADDYEEGGSHCTAEDYREAARRIEEKSDV